MHKRLTEPFGKAGLIVAAIALVFAMLGGAYAASNSGSGKATASAKAKKGPRGPKGPKGDTGAQGPVGPAGAPGKDGTNGTNGKDGAEGKEGPEGKAGKNGTSVVSSAEPEGANCAKGGSKFVAGASTTYACNGQTGFTETLPSGKTETGAWAVSQIGATSSGNVPTAISFPIPLSSAGTEESAVWLNKTQTEEAEPGNPVFGCEGFVNGSPTAPAGTLCVYTLQQSVNVSNVFTGVNLDEEFEAYNAFGAVMQVTVTSSGDFFIAGAYAVTAP
jgi:hypothetical protein